jgi:catechol-2,3-dioxygenase
MTRKRLVIPNASEGSWLKQNKGGVMITTTGIYHIGIPVNDVERAVKFYTEVLGMKIAKLNRDDMEII